MSASGLPPLTASPQNPRITPRVDGVADYGIGPPVMQHRAVHRRRQRGELVPEYPDPAATNGDRATHHRPSQHTDRRHGFSVPGQRQQDQTEQCELRNHPPAATITKPFLLKLDSH